MRRARRRAARNRMKAKLAGFKQFASGVVILRFAAAAEIDEHNQDSLRGFQFRPYLSAIGPQRRFPKIQFVEQSLEKLLSTSARIIGLGDPPTRRIATINADQPCGLD